VTDYLTLVETLAIHEHHIERFGGAPGVRDLGQLEAALFRPQTGYYPELIAQAAALWESLSQNHPFIDANKRTAFAAMAAFLIINGVILTADADECWRFLSKLYEADALLFESLERWLRMNTSGIVTTSAPSKSRNAP
jgi:death-on-curing protein